jgi:hypothetical protein
MQSNAERQRAYRQRQRQEGSQAQLKVTVSLPTQQALQRLCQHYSLTPSELLDQVVAGAERRVLAGMTAAGQARFHEAVTA